MRYPSILDLYRWLFFGSQALLVYIDRGQQCWGQEIHSSGKSFHLGFGWDCQRLGFFTLPLSFSKYQELTLLKNKSFHILGTFLTFPNIYIMGPIRKTLGFVYKQNFVMKFLTFYFLLLLMNLICHQEHDFVQVVKW